MPPSTKTPKNVDEQQAAGAYVGPLAANGARSADPTASSVEASLEALADPTGALADPAAPVTEPMTPSLGVVAAGDRCAGCGSPMASDQRYCLVCGERRGQARFAATAPPTGTGSRTTTTSEPVFSASRFSPGTTLIAGIATLLLAMGIGVLIGEQGNSSGSGSSKSPVVYLNGSGSTGSSGAAATSGAAGTSRSSSGSGGHNSSHTSSGTGGHSGAVKTVKSSAPPTVTVGAKGTGKGYSHGHFTGNFFGP